MHNKSSAGKKKMRNRIRDIEGNPNWWNRRKSENKGGKNWPVICWWLYVGL